MRYALALLLFGGCGEEVPKATPTAAPEASEVGGRVVSTVDGQPITVEDVERVARSAELSPAEALRRLQRYHLLAGEAERRGFGANAAVRQASRKAAVQELLAMEVEAPPSLDDEDAQVRERFGRLTDLVDSLASQHGVDRDPEGWAQLAAWLDAEVP
jgi:hypothetical protein